MQPEPHLDDLWSTVNTVTGFALDGDDDDHVPRKSALQQLRSDSVPVFLSPPPVQAQLQPVPQQQQQQQQQHDEHAQLWFYKDPEGKIQGPFDSDEMATWFEGEGGGGGFAFIHCRLA